MKFFICSRFGIPPRREHPCLSLNWDDWNDYDYYTAFHLNYYDAQHVKYEIGAIKIAFKGQRKNDDKKYNVGESFEKIDDEHFSIGASDEYYENLNSIKDSITNEVLEGLNDIALNLHLLKEVKNEDVFQISFLRNYEYETIVNQLHSIAKGGARLTKFSFIYTYPPIYTSSIPSIDFRVIPFNLPPSNLHVIIGRNGVGKTYLLSNLKKSFFDNNHEFGTLEFWSGRDDSETFINLVDVSYSMFDAQSEIRTNNNNYYRVGNNKERQYPIENYFEKDDFLISVGNINADSKKRGRLQKCIEILESDRIFKNSNIFIILKDEKNNFKQLRQTYNRFSSGHKIILDVIVKLVDKVAERTLLIMDEPETHLHPPLLSSFTRALSYLLIDRNGVGIIATHSPVILQEVPKDCVWKLERNDSNIDVKRLEIETFGTNIDVLTREVFGLEVTDSGFHNLLKKIASESETFDEAVSKFNNELGADGRAILRTLFRTKANG